MTDLHPCDRHELYMKERRSRTMASRFFRFTMQRKVYRMAPLLMILGCTLVLVAQTTKPEDDTSVHLAFVGALFGGALGFMGMFAGISKWVADPAARKVMAEHLSRGAAAHPELMARPEWDAKHTELMDEVGEIKVMLAELSGRRGGMTRERNS